MDGFFQQGRFRRLGLALHRRRHGLSARGRDRSDVERHGRAITDPKVTTIDVKRLGPAAAREIGTFSLKTKGSPSKEVTGKYVVIWERVGRDWKLATDIWNEGK